MKIKYVANDGTEFDTREECIEYESSKLSKEEIDTINKAFKIISDHCAKQESCEGCPFSTDANCYSCCFNEASEEWKLLLTEEV